LKKKQDIYGPEEIITYEVKSKESKDLHLHLLDYLYTKQMPLEVWDAEKAMILGVSRIPLQLLIRRGQQVVVRTIEVDICEPNHGAKLGCL